MPRWISIGFILIVVLLLILLAVFKSPRLGKIKSDVEQTLMPTPTPFVFTTYTPPKIENKETYTIFMVGDSMTWALGPHGGTLHGFINNDMYIKDGKYILIDNYAVGSTNVLSLNEGALTTQTTFWDSTFEPLLTRDFDLILIESFGYNPLSSFGLEEGLKAQTEALDKAMTTIISTHPNSAVVFVATIAPSKNNYAKGVILNIPDEQRAQQAEERIAYIKNHIAYANAHNIPVINIFEKSKNEQGGGDLKYINPDDYIHPSFEGVDFIGREISSYIYTNQILPH